MFKDIKQVMKDSVLYGIGNVAVKLVGFILIPLYTDAEYFSKIDADHIFFFSDDGTVGDTANLPTWQNLKAVKNGNVYCGLNEMQYDLAFTPNGKLMYMEQMVNAIINHENIDK